MLLSAGYNLLAIFAFLLAAVRPVAANECLDCHSGVLAQMKGKSHHIQGVTVSGIHCYACHWEATAKGEIDIRYHEGSSSARGSGGSGANVDLVLWSEGERPTVFKPFSTAVSFRNSAIGTAQERTEFARITSHCLSCHSERNNQVSPFTGDSMTPRQYAWDGRSVASRYNQKGVTTWGKYSSASTNKKKRVIKSFSAHGNASANQGGWNPAKGYDGDMPITRGGAGAKNVECFDCHNSHGSQVAGVTSSYRTHNGTFNGGILKETVAGKGGYRTSYTPSVNSSTQGKNPYNAGAGLCFDCHEARDTGTTPWGFYSTFGASQPIIGYKDTLKFGPGSKGSTARFTSRQTRTDIASSHLQAGKLLNFSTHAKINGLCTPCHDPHGVSPSLGEKMPYAVPLLKGTWLTSPYLDDGPPSTPPGKPATGMSDPGSGQTIPSGASAVSASGGAGSPREPISRAGVKYNIDRNTFAGNNRIAEDDETFSGICLQCHPKQKLRSESSIHRAVKGWGNNKEHSFPCSKCHQAHNSGLPRLMQTNCFEVGPADLRESSGLPWLPERPGSKKQGQPTGSSNDVNSKSKTSGKVTVVGCHVKQFGKGSSPANKKGADQWQQKSTW